MSTVTMICYWCKKEYELRKAEYNRQIKCGKERFFCSLSCCCKYRNSLYNHIYVIEKNCPTCKKIFISTTHAKASKYCSRGCASKGSVTDYRRERARENGRLNLKHTPKIIAASLRSREWFKYRKLHKFLKRREIKHKFEYVCGKYIFDLALIKRKVFLEFDGGTKKSQIQNIKKDELANNHGWQVVHVPLKRNEIVTLSIVRNVYDLSTIV